MPQLIMREPQAAIEADVANGIEAAPAEDPGQALHSLTVEALDTYFNPHDNHLHYDALFGSQV